MKTQPRRKCAGRLSLFGLAGLIGVAVTLPSIAGSRYTITDLGTVPGSAESGVFGQQALNNRGQVVVFANNIVPFYGFEDSSFLWAGPTKTELLPGLPDATSIVAMGLNDRDQVVGMCGVDDGNVFRPVLWENGNAYELATPSDDLGTGAYCINDEGVIVGTSTANSGLIRALVWHDGKVQILPSLPGAFFTQANAVNDRGQIVGMSGPDFSVHYHAVIWDLGTIIDLGTLGGTTSEAQYIDNQKRIVGFAQTASGDIHSSIWENGEIKDLGNFASDPFGIANGINSKGQIVGFSGQSWTDISTAHALLWQRNGMTELQTLIPAHSGWVLQQAVCINDRGQVAGFGLHENQVHAFLLAPVEGE